MNKVKSFDKFLKIKDYEDTIPVTIRNLPEEQHAMLKLLAKDRDVSLNSLLLAILEDVCAGGR